MPKLHAPDAYENLVLSELGGADAHAVLDLGAVFRARAGLPTFSFSDALRPAGMALS
jgi:hypothetical protein